MINLLDSGLMPSETKSGDKILSVVKIHKYTSNQGTFINLVVKNNVYYETVSSFVLELSEFTASNVLIKKMIISRKGCNFSASYQDTDDLIQIDDDCERIEAKVVEVDFISFKYRENGFVLPNDNKENASLEIGEYRTLKRKQVYAPYAFTAHALLTMLIICFVILFHFIGGFY